MTKILEQNLKKCDELDPSIIEPTKEAVIAAFDKNMFFTISEARRTYERQCLLFSQGRTKSEIMRNVFPYGFFLNSKQMKDMLKIYDEGKNLHGTKVTWTLDSDHIKGLAIDVYPQNTTYTELALFWTKWGITHPYIQDKPHFNLSSIKSLNPKINQTPSARLGALSRALLRNLRPEVRSVIEREYKILRSRLGV